MATGAMTGRHVETVRGYVIRQWTGVDIDAGTVKPFTSQPDGNDDYQRHATLDEARAYIATAPRVRKVNVSFETTVVGEATDEQIEEWLRFELHENGTMNGKNPLAHQSLEASYVSIDRIDEE